MSGAGRAALALLLAASVSPATAAAAAPLRTCDANGTFVASNFSQNWIWTLHDTHGELRGEVRYVAWVPDVDVEPSIRQRAALAGSRSGTDLTLDVANPFHDTPVRRLRAKLLCPDASPRPSPAILIFPVHRKYSDRVVFAKVDARMIALILTIPTKTNRQHYDVLIGSVKRRAQHDAHLRAYLEASRLRMTRSLVNMLDEIAAAANAPSAP